MTSSSKLLDVGVSLRKKDTTKIQLLWVHDGCLIRAGTAYPSRAPHFTPDFWWGPCCSSFWFFVLPYYVSLRSEFRVVMSVTIYAWKRYSVPLYLQLFEGMFMSYLHYLCLFPYSGCQHILCCIFALFAFVLCTLCCQFLWIVNFLIVPSVFAYWKWIDINFALK